MNSRNAHICRQGSLVFRFLLNWLNRISIFPYKPEQNVKIRVNEVLFSREQFNCWVLGYILPCYSMLYYKLVACGRRVEKALICELPQSGRLLLSHFIHEMTLVLKFISHSTRQSLFSLNKMSLSWLLRLINIGVRLLSTKCPIMNLNWLNSELFLLTSILKCYVIIYSLRDPNCKNYCSHSKYAHSILYSMQNTSHHMNSV